MIKTAKIKIAPSLLAADVTRLAEEVMAIEKAGADMIHVDVMDGHFVPNMTFGPLVVRALRSITRLPLDVHLMIAPVDPMVLPFIEAGAHIISVHPESGPHVHRTLQVIKSHGVKASLALNPGTPVDVLSPVMDLLDMVLVMTVNPGFGGQQFLKSQLEKIAQVRQLIDASGRSIALQVDGGINPTTAALALEKGADILVAGTAVFQGDASLYAAHMNALRGQ